MPRGTVVYLLSGVQYPECLAEYIVRCVFITVVDRPAYGTFPFPGREIPDLRIFISATGTCLARRIERRHLDNITSMLKGFVLQQFEEL